jgi:hypothetical protein
MRGIALVAILLLTSFSPALGNATAQPDIIEEYWYHSYLSLTQQVNQWEANYPDTVKLVTAGQTELGREQWVVQISNWANDTAPNGSAKTKIYIDGGHHGNEHLGTELAFLVAEYYIEESASGNEEALAVLETTEIHVMIMLNADGNDADNRWNNNAIDLNRNYDHMWTEEETRSGRGGPFSESETRNNADYMAEYMVDADLYVTMHTGVWILAYPWGWTGDMPADWELYTHMADEIHANISPDLPIRNANAGIYPTHGTSRDYGYGVMGYPTFTFETDDEQFLPGTTERLSDRLGLELEVMRYLIRDAWFWRAHLEVDSVEVSGDEITLDVNNVAHASTANATLQWIDSSGEVGWNSSLFAVNASNSSHVILDSTNLTMSDGGFWNLYYQVRVVEVSRWVNETVDESLVSVIKVEDDGFLLGYGLFNPLSLIMALSVVAILKPELSEIEISE